MKRVVVFILLVASAASAQSTGDENSSQPGAPPGRQRGLAAYLSPDPPVHLLLDPARCDSADAPVPWRDSADPWRFASQPLEQLSSGGALFAQLRSLVELRVTLSSVRLFLVGASPPAWGHLQLVGRSGWQLSGC